MNGITKLFFGLISFQILVLCVLFRPQQLLRVASEEENEFLAGIPILRSGTKATDTALALKPREDGNITQQQFLNSNATFDPIFDSIFNISELKLLFVHVGKTGGTTIDKVLRSNCDYYRDTGNKDSRKRCITELCCSDDELLLSKLTQKTIHMFIPVRELKQKFSSHDVLWSIRNPISRIVSALDMKANNAYSDTVGVREDLYFRECGFQSVQDLADALEYDNERNTTTRRSRNSIIQLKEKKRTLELDCREFGQNTLEGSRWGMKGHNTMNYVYYSKVSRNIPNGRNIVLRTEYLWEDIIQTNGLLVGAASRASDQLSRPFMDNQEGKATWISDIMNISSHRFTHGSESWKIKSKLTQRGKEIVCCYLFMDNQHYERLMLSAVNLSDQQKAQSMESVYRDCGILPLAKKYLSKNGGFGWRKWKVDGCPKQTKLTK